MSRRRHRDAHPNPILPVFFTVFIDLVGFGIVLPLLPIFAKNLAATRRLTDGFEFEMLQGMATKISKVITPDIGSPLLYTPVVAPRDFVYMTVSFFEVKAKELKAPLLSVAPEDGVNEMLEDFKIIKKYLIFNLFFI